MNIQRGIQLSDKAVRQYWLRGLAKTMVQSGATAVSTWLGLAGASSIGLNVPVLDLYAVAVVFCSQAAVAAFNYLKEHPLPDQDDIPEHVEQAMAEQPRENP